MRFNRGRGRTYDGMQIECRAAVNPRTRRRRRRRRRLRYKTLYKYTRTVSASLFGRLFAFGFRGNVEKIILRPRVCVRSLDGFRKLDAPGISGELLFFFRLVRYLLYSFSFYPLYSILSEFTERT